jgi:outer membrane immunogenic protein
MIKYTTAAAIAAMLASTTLAHAQTQPAEGSWTGFNLGVQLGMSNGELSYSGLSQDDDTTVYGFHAGYNHDFGMWILGGELEYSIAEYDALGVDVDTDTTRLKARGGYDMGRSLLYGVLSYGDIDLESKALGGSVSDKGFGFGLGVDFKATENIIIGVEYLKESFEQFGVDADVNSLSLRASYQF